MGLGDGCGDGGLGPDKSARMDQTFMGPLGHKFAVGPPEMTSDLHLPNTASCVHLVTSKCPLRRQSACVSMARCRPRNQPASLAGGPRLKIIKVAVISIPIWRAD